MTDTTSEPAAPATFGDAVAVLQRDYAHAMAGGYRRLLDGWGTPPAWEPLPVEVSDRGVVTIGRWGGYWLQVAPMAFNDRLLLTPERHPTGLWAGDGCYDFAWCYPRGLNAYLGALLWNPGAEGEPPMYERRAAGRRAPAQTARGWNGGAWNGRDPLPV